MCINNYFFNKKFIKFNTKLIEHLLKYMQRIEKFVSFISIIAIIFYEFCFSIFQPIFAYCLLHEVFDFKKLRRI